MNETIKETKSNEQVVAGELVVPAERDSKGVYKGPGRPSKVDKVIEKFGDKMILDLASRKRGIKSAALGWLIGGTRTACQYAMLREGGW